MTVTKSACKAKNPEFCRYHSSRSENYNARAEKSYNFWKEELANAKTLDDRSHAEESLSEAELEYAATDAGREMLEQQRDSATDPMEQERLNNVLADADHLREYIESKADGIVRFPASKMEEAEKRIDKANRKLERAGIEDRFSYTTEEYIEHDKEGNAFTMVALSLSRPQISYNGWTFAAAVDKTDNGATVIRSGAGELNGYRPEEFKCDHCGSNRRRSSTYLLRNEEGEYKQVGSNCLQSFLGVKPSGLWALDYDPEAGDEFIDRGRRSPGSADSAIPTTELVAAALAVSDGGEKYVSKKAAYDWGDTSTVSDVQSYFWSKNRDQWKDIDHHSYTEQAKELLANTTFEGEDDYNTNMRALLSNEYTSVKHMGFVASVIAANRRQKRDTEKAKAEAVKAVGYLGKPEEKLKNLKLKVLKSHPITNYYNGVERPSTLLIMEDAQGRQVKWYATGSRDYEDGAEITISSATIKDNDTFNGNEQTVITRARVVES